MKNFENKVAVITGAGSGIGRGIAETFAKHGANVLFTYSNSSDLAKKIEKDLSGIIENSKKGHDFAARVFVVKKTG